MQRSKVALIAGVLGAIGLLGPAIGAALAHFGAVPPLSGFVVFGISLLLGLIAGALGLLAFYTTRAAVNRSGRPLAWLALVAAATAIGVIGFARSGVAVPPINDISTDLVEPPAFGADPSDRGRDMAFPAGFAEQIKATAAYRDLRPAHVARAPAEVLGEVEATARALQWKVVSVDTAAGTVVANDTTKLFRFVDDIVVRVRDDGAGGSIVDVRSKSRDGQGDNGVNAERIRRFYAALPK
ncbi:MAG TPA: DUF1499 domain-containing protein [Casimicrobiaceae bacterium]|nr:DUF1499 domain-containing protein [Casimicrobiaceae bacterium]